MSLNFDYLSCEERLDASIARLEASLARGKSPVCGPSDLNGTALCSDSVVPGPGVRIPAIGEAVATLRKPAQPESVLTAKGSLSSDVVEPCQDTLKTGVSTPALGAALFSRVVGNGALVKSSALNSTGRVVKPVCGLRNASPWHQVSEFLNTQHLASLGLRMLP